MVLSKIKATKFYKNKATFISNIVCLCKLAYSNLKLKKCLKLTNMVSF